MLPGMELMNCPEMAVPKEVMHHVVRVESSYNPYAIGVVGGHLVRQPKTLAEALSTVRMLERRGFNFSIGLAQVNRYNLGKYGLKSYQHAFEVCPNLQAGSRILAECYQRHQDWGKSFSCYYSGNPITGFRHGYVQKVFASVRQAQGRNGGNEDDGIAVVSKSSRKAVPVEHFPLRGNARIESMPVSRAVPLSIGSVESNPDPAFIGARVAPAVPVAAPAAQQAVDVSPMAVAPNAVVGPQTGASTLALPMPPTPNGPVRLQPTQPAAVVPASKEAATGRNGDDAFVF